MTRHIKGSIRKKENLLMEIGKLYEFFSYDLDTIVGRFITIAEKIVSFDASGLMHFAEETGKLRMISQKNTDLRPEELIDLSLNDFQIFDKDNIPVNLVEQITDSTANPVFKKGGRVRSFVTTPLITRNKIIGLLFLGSFQERLFDHDDLELVYAFSSQLAVAIDNIMLYEKSVKNLETLKQIHDIQKKISRPVEIEKRIDIGLDELQKLCRYDAAAFLFFADDNNDLVIRDSRGIDTHKAELFRLPIATLAKEVKDALLIEKRYLVTGNLLRETGLKPFTFSDKTRSALVVPIVYEENILALLAIASNNVYYFNEEIIQKLELLVEHFSIAIQNSLFYEDIKQKIREVEDSNRVIRDYSDKLKEINLNLERNIEQLSTLFEIAKIINSSPSLLETLNLILSRTATLVSADKGSIMLIDEENYTLKLKAQFGMAHDKELKLTLRIGEGIAGWVAKTGRPRITEDVARDPMYFKNDLSENLNFSMISVPLKINEKVIGVLNVEKNLKLGTFNRDDLNILGTLAEHAAIALEKSQYLQDAIDLFDQTVGALASAIDAKDSYTFGHTDRVRILAELIARKLNLPDREVKAIGRAALLHDIGKIGIPEKILLKPGKLGEKEMEQIKEHSILGAGILEPIRQIRYEASLILHHHEHFDGSGYPDGLKGDEIPLGSRIIMAADTYDSITTDRPYRAAQPELHAINEIKRFTGTQFDPLVVGAFVSIVDEYRAVIKEKGLLKHG